MTAPLVCLSLAVAPFVTLPLAGSLAGEVSSPGFSPTLRTADSDEVLPSDLTLQDLTPTEILALALADAAQGNFTAALTRLEAGIADAGDDPLAARLQRAADRTQALMTVREGWLTKVGAGGVKIKVPIEGKLKTVSVTGIVDGRIKFQRGFGNVNSWGVGEFDALLLAQNLGSDVKEYGAEWSRGWAYLIGGNDKWAKYLKGDKEVVAQIKTDGEGMADLLASGRGLHAFATLASRAPATDTVTAQVILDDIVVVRELGKDLDIYLEQEGTLKQLAYAALDINALATDLKDLLVGKVTDLGDGRIRVEYAFDDPNELNDFIVQPELFADRFPADQTQLEPEAYAVVHEKGRLSFLGRIGILHQLQFEGVMGGEFEVSYNDAIGDVAGPFPLVHMGIAATADGERRNAVLDFRGSESMTDAGNLYFYQKDPAPIEGGDTLKCRIDIDAEQTMTSSADDVPFDAFKEIGETYGAAFITVQVAELNYLERMSFEGTPRRNSLASLRQHWVSKRMQAMGW